MAFRAGYSKRQYERVESGHPTTFDTLLCFTRVLGCDPDDVVDSPRPEVEGRLLAEGPAQVLDNHFRAKRLSERMKNATLSSVSSRPFQGISLIVRTATKGDITLCLRPDATIGEIAHAIPKHYVAKAYHQYQWLVTDADGDQYDVSVTAESLAARSISVVYLRKHQGLPLAVMDISVLLIKVAVLLLNVFLRLFFSLGGRLARFKWKCFFFKELRCRLYCCLFSRKAPHSRVPPRLIVWDMAGMMQLYAEANVKIERATRMAELIAKSDASGKYQDTLAWVCYREGRYKLAFGIMNNITVPQENPPPKVLTYMYHSYFICKQLGFVDASNLMQECFAEVIEPQVRKGMFSLFPPPLYELEFERVRLSDDSLGSARPSTGIKEAEIQRG